MAPGRATLHRLLAAFGVALPAALCRRSAHGLGATYDVRAPAGRFALRVVGPAVPDAQLAFVAAWLDHLRRRGVPVAPALRTTAGAPVARTDGWRAMLHPWMVGCVPGRRLSPARWAALGALTARLHEAGAGFAMPGDVPRWDAARLFGPGTLLAVGADGPGDGLLTSAERAVFVAAEPRVRSLLDEAARVPGVAGPIHSDLHPANVVFTRERGPVPIDFAEAGWGALAFDLAAVLLELELLDPPANAPACTGAYLAAYAALRPSFQLDPAALRRGMAARCVYEANSVADWPSGERTRHGRGHVERLAGWVGRWLERPEDPG